MRKSKIICAREAAEYILSTHCTIKECAKHFSASKTTIHASIQKDKDLRDMLAPIFQQHIKERARNGGLATREHWLKQEKK